MATKRKSGPSGYRAEHEVNRATVAVLLRVAPDVAESFATMASDDDKTKVAFFTDLVTKERARRDRR